MSNTGKFAAYHLAVSLALAAFAQAANAACGASMVGVWHFHAIEGGGSATKCIATVAADGSFTAPCTIYQNGSADVSHKTYSGNFALSGNCDLTGSIKVGGYKPKIIIKSGHINGVTGTGTATQGATTALQVLHFDMVMQ